MERLLKQVWPSLLWTALIFILLSMDTNGMDGSGLMKIKGVDKLIHFVLFLLFSLLWSSYLMLSNKMDPKTAILYVILLGSTYGLGMEFYQRYFTNRSFSYWDAVADAVGAIAGAWWAIKKPLWK